jgi:hypothetical protein
LSWPRAAGTVAVATLAGVSGCSSSYQTRDGGADSGMEDVSDEGDAADDGGAGDDATDGGSCTEVPVTVLPAHGGPACPLDGSACYPSDVTSFTPTWIPPVAGAPHAKLCTQAQISEALKDCIDVPTPNGSTCQTWVGQAPANSACLACLETDSSAGRYGAVIRFGPIASLNVAGCVALAEPCNLPCAKALQAQQRCPFYACNPQSGPCQVTDTASYDSNQACANEASTMCGCSGFDAPGTSCNSALQDPSMHRAAILCDMHTPTSFDPQFTAIATFLCGP